MLPSLKMAILLLKIVREKLLKKRSLELNIYDIYDISEINI